MTVIGFVRHGNTNWNIEKRAQGHSHNPLNETGHKQAHAVGQRLAKENWDVIISSDLLRARQTAEIIASYMEEQPIVYDKRLREMSRGQIEGTIEEERIKIWGKDWRKLNLGEETVEEIRGRGIQFVKDILKQYEGQRILVITHGRFLIETLHELCPDQTDLKVPIKNCSVTIMQDKENGLNYDLYNCTRHLSEKEFTK